MVNLTDFNFESFEVTFFIKYRGGQIVPLYYCSREKRQVLGSCGSFEICTVSPQNIHL